MNVEIGTEAVQFPEKEYIKGIFLAVQSRRSGSSRLHRLRFLCRRQAKRKTGAVSSVNSFSPGTEAYVE
jgi:hypothetical protein